MRRTSFCTLSARSKRLKEFHQSNNASCLLGSKCLTLGKQLTTISSLVQHFTLYSHCVDDLCINTNYSCQIWLMQKRQATMQQLYCVLQHIEHYKQRLQGLSEK